MDNRNDQEMESRLVVTLPLPLIRCYTQLPQAEAWLQRYAGQRPCFSCVLGFTATGLIPNISAAGATPADRQYTAIADAEFLYHGYQPQPQHPLPPLQAGASPVLISRAVIANLDLPLQVFNAGLPHPPSIPVIDLQGVPAACLSHGQALPLRVVEQLLQQGLVWGERLAIAVPDSYLIVSECVVGGTTTALAILLGLGVDAVGKVNSSHPTCNHEQKLAIAQTGLSQAKARGLRIAERPLDLVAGVGDPMQIVVAGLAIAASRHCGVMLAGGTQMLAVYALARAIAQRHHLAWQPHQIVVGTTRWVADDPTGDTVGLATAIGDVPLLATQLSFAQSRHATLQAYERGYVKEGVGAGAAAIAASLYAGWQQTDILNAVDQLADQLVHPQTSPDKGFADQECT